jgi:hypothetical protein
MRKLKKEFHFNRMQGIIEKNIEKVFYRTERAITTNYKYTKILIY